MVTNVSVNSIYNCSLERAFKTPILCDISKVHTGYGFSPKVTHCENDENWGKEGFSKKVFVAPTFLQKGGWAFDDKVIERVENKYWVLEVSNFQMPIFGFRKFIGTWKTTEIEANKILIEYSYSLHSNNSFLYPVHWLFGKIFWKQYMKQIVENVKSMINEKELYLYN